MSGKGYIRFVIIMAILLLVTEYTFLNITKMMLPNEFKSVAPYWDQLLLVVMGVTAGVIAVAAKVLYKPEIKKSDDVEKINKKIDSHNDEQKLPKGMKEIEENRKRLLNGDKTLPLERFIREPEPEPVEEQNTNGKVVIGNSTIEELERVTALLKVARLNKIIEKVNKGELDIEVTENDAKDLGLKFVKNVDFTVAPTAKKGKEIKITDDDIKSLFDPNEPDESDVEE